MKRLIETDSNGCLTTTFMCVTFMSCSEISSNVSKNISMAFFAGGHGLDCLSVRHCRCYPTCLVKYVMHIQFSISSRKGLLVRRFYYKSLLVGYHNWLAPDVWAYRTWQSNFLVWRKLQDRDMDALCAPAWTVKEHHVLKPWAYVCMFCCNMLVSWTRA